LFDWNQVQNILLWVSGWDGNVSLSSQNPCGLGSKFSAWSFLAVSISRVAPDPKSSNLVFGDGVLIENGEIIFGVVEKKTVGASQGGLVHVARRA